MIRTLRSLFLARPLREKIMLVGFVLLVALMWLSSLSGRLGHMVREVSATSRQLKEQGQWLANRAEIEGSARQAAARFDPSRTLNSTQLVAALAEISDGAGLHNTSGNPSSDQQSGPLSYHTMQYNITRANWTGLEAFYVALRDRAPYIAIEGMQIQADRGGGSDNNLNVSLKISSVEISQHGAP